VLYFGVTKISAITRAHVINVTRTTYLQPGKPHSTPRSLRQGRRCLFLETVSLSLKKNYRVLTGSVYREPAELKILLYFDLCYENTLSATTRAHVMNVTHTTYLQPGKPHSTPRSLRQARRSFFLETVSLSSPE
jgi:hypothetical protein